MADENEDLVRARIRLPEPISTTIEYLSADGDFS